MSHTPGPWTAKRGGPDFREGWSVEAPNSPHPLGESFSRQDNVVGKCCSAGVYREADARLIAAAPDLLAALKRVRKAYGGLLDDKTNKVVEDAVEKAERRTK